MTAPNHVVNIGAKVENYISGDGAVMDGALLEENIASLTDSVGEQSAREGFDKLEEIKAETVKVGSPKDNFASPIDSEGATGGEESGSDSDEDGSDPEDSGSEDAISDGASAGSSGKSKMGEVAGDCRGNGSETCDGGNQPPSPGLAILEIEEDFANKLLDLGINVGHPSSSQSVECGRRLQSGVCKEPVGSAHQVFDYLPQGNAEGKGQVRTAVSSPRTWANIVASDIGFVISGKKMVFSHAPLGPPRTGFG
ncbi:hypothetical protein U1Q18_003384 [Sarracenia purpurea var. burkii]